VQRLLTHHTRLHWHLNWQDVDTWLTGPAAMVCLGWQGRNLAALMAASTPHGGASWLRLIALDGGVPVQAALRALWGYLRPALADAGARRVFVLAGYTWLEQAVETLAFAHVEDVVTLRRVNRAGWELPPPRADLILRPVEARDLTAVLAVDHAAFDSLWWLEEEDLYAVLRQPMAFTLGEQGGSVVGYEISALYAEGGHITRLATAPAMQGQGVGGTLLRRALLSLEAAGVEAITLNTQRSNEASLRLYRRFGFELTGHSVPVWQATIGV
jgi:ribosomal protein S18 acetylase RimI-like enzyme